MFSARVISSRLSSRMLVRSLSRKTTLQPFGIGPWASSQARTCTWRQFQRPKPGGASSRIFRFRYPSASITSVPMGTQVWGRCPRTKRVSTDRPPGEYFLPLFQGTSPFWNLVLMPCRPLVRPDTGSW